MIKRCLFCNHADPFVETVGSCTNRCTLDAHPKCFESRKTSLLWRKSNGQKGNTDAERCLHIGCQGKLRCVASAAKTSELRPMPTKRDRFEGLPVECENACSFFTRDMRPCPRAATEHNACKLHQRDALLLKSMVENLEARQEEVCIPCDTPSEAVVAVQIMEPTVQSIVTMDATGDNQEALETRLREALQATEHAQTERDLTRELLERSQRDCTRARNRVDELLIDLERARDGWYANGYEEGYEEGRTGALAELARAVECLRVS